MESMEYEGYLILNTDRGEWTVFEDASKEQVLWVAATVGDCIAVIDEVMADM